MANAVAASVITADDVVARGGIVNAFIAAVGTAETVYVTVPYTGTISKAYFVSDAAGNSADAAITLKTAADAAIAEFTIETAYAAGTVKTDSTLQNTSVTDGTALKLATDGGGGSAGKGYLTLVII